MNHRLLPFVIQLLMLFSRFRFGYDQGVFGGKLVASCKLKHFIAL